MSNHEFFPIQIRNVIAIFLNCGSLREKLDIVRLYVEHYYSRENLIFLSRRDKIS